MIDVVEILQHWHAGRPKTTVAASLGVDVKTVRKYVAKAEAEGICPGDKSDADRAAWAARVAGWFPELVDAKARSRTWPELEARRELIELMLATNSIATVHQRLRDEHGLSASVTSLRRFVWEVLPQRTAAPVTVLRPSVPPGEAQIDYGYLGRWVDPAGGRTRKVNAFVMLLACSRHLFVRPVFSMDQASWIAAHVAAFEFFGGVPDRMVIDNLKTGVLTPDLYDPLLNRGYAELAGHYGTLIDPARAAKPKDKARVERGHAVHPGLVLAWPQLRQPDRHADGGGSLVAAGRPASGRTGAWTARARSRSSTPLSARRCGRCRRWRSSRSAGSRRRSRRTVTSRSAGCFIRFPSPMSARPPTRGCRRRRCRSTSTGSWSRPGRGPTGAGAPTRATIRRRRSHSSPAIRTGAAAARPSSERQSRSSSAACWTDMRCTICGRRRA